MKKNRMRRVLALILILCLTIAGTTYADNDELKKKRARA